MVLLSAMISDSMQHGEVASDLVRQIAEHAPCVMLVAAAADGRIVFANRAAHRAAGCAAGELVGQIAGDAFAFVDRSLLTTGARTRVPTVADRIGDTSIGGDVSYVALRAEDCGDALVLITAVDVTHHEIASAKAHAAQNTLDALLAYVPEGISISQGPQIHVARVSARGMALLGRNADELTDRSALQQTDVWQVYRPGSDVPLPPADRPLARATRTGEIAMNETLLVRRSNGSMLTLLCNSGPIRDAAGEVTGAIMTWQDVTELQRAQASLQGWAIHEDGSPYDLSEYPSRRALYNGETVRAEPMMYSRGDGRLIDLEMHAGPVRGETGEVIAAVAVALDVTERHITEARQAFLFQLQDSLRTLTEPREMLTTAAAHLGRHLGAARVGYGEMQPDGATVLITNGYAQGVPPVNAPLPLMMLGPYHAAQMRKGKTVAYEDVQSDDRVQLEYSLKFGIRAHVSVPLVRDGQYTGSLDVTHDKPHRWTANEIALIEEVAARIWDAAERGRAEARLRESEERLRLVMESTGLGSWEYDVASGTTIRSARHDEIFGYSTPVNDWSYENFKAHIPDPDRARVDEGLRAALEEGKYLEVECRMVRVEGVRGWLKVSARPHYGADGRIARLIGTIEDITVRKDAAYAAIETAAKFEMFAQTVPSMVWTSLPDGRIDWFNARVPEYCGIPADEMKPDGWTPVHPDDLASSAALYQEALATGNPYVSEYRIRRHDGMYRWHITRAIPIRGADGAITRWIGTSADIQDRKSSEQALAELNATLEQQVRERTAELLAAEARLRQSQKMEAVGQLTGGLAHDFNNLLTGIAGSLELMANRLAQGRVAEIPRYLTLAQGAAKRAAALTHRLLAFSRRQTLDPKPTDIGQLVCGMDELIRRTVSPAVALNVVGAPALWPVLADPNQLENALLNLCINARDAMPDGGSLTIETRNRLLQTAEAIDLELQGTDYVCLSVSDTGGGMAAHVIERAFDPFFTTKPMGEGTGLGLSMVYGFVRQSGGQARIASQLGKGTTVSLYLPRYSGDSRGVELSEGKQDVVRGAGETVLVVADESSVRTLISEVLDELGYHVLEAEHGAAGLEILESKQRVDLLITDVGLPGGMNGRQLADAALVTRPHLKVLFITGYAETAVIGAGRLQAGMHVLTKPFSLESLGWRIREIIAAE
jgi:PAS domain S-box-containing protein